MERITNKQKRRIVAYFDNLLRSLSYRYFFMDANAEQFIKGYVEDHELPKRITRYFYVGMPDAIMIQIFGDDMITRLYVKAEKKNETENSFDVSFTHSTLEANHGEK